MSLNEDGHAARSLMSTIAIGSRILTSKMSSLSRNGRRKKQQASNNTLPHSDLILQQNLGYDPALLRRRIEIPAALRVSLLVCKLN
jgi:hypothetical protein